MKIDFHRLLMIAAVLALMATFFAINLQMDVAVDVWESVRAFRIDAADKK